jgi:hypothetical protein
MNVLKTPMEIAVSCGSVISDKEAHIVGPIIPSPKPNRIVEIRRINMLVENGRSKVATAKKVKPRASKSFLPTLSDKKPEGAETTKLEMDMTERIIPICVKFKPIISLPYIGRIVETIQLIVKGLRKPSKLMKINFFELTSFLI